MRVLAGNDFSEDLKSLIDYLNLNHADKINSLDYEGDLGRILLRIIAHSSASLGYSMDSKVLEAFPTLARLRQSLIHHANSRGYRIRGASAAVVQALCRSSSVALDSSPLQVRKGTVIKDSNGLPWEITGDYYIQPGNSFPIAPVLTFGNIVSNVVSESSSRVVQALIKIEPGSNMVILTDELGNRLPSSANFGDKVSSGHILQLLSTFSNGSFGPAPDITRDEYAVISVSSMQQDQHPGSVLYLDRAWTGSVPFIGKWEIQNRSIALKQGQTFRESFTSPEDIASLVGLSRQVSFYPVIWEGNEPYSSSGPMQVALGDRFSGNLNVRVFVNGFQWQESATLSLEASTSQAYEVQFDEQDRMTVVFGDGTFGSLVPAGSNIVIEYRVGGGEEGNIPQGALETTIQAFSPNGGGVSVYISNPYTTGSGGRNRETIQEARANIVSFTKSNDRGVSEEDLDSLASRFSDPEAGRVAVAKCDLRSSLAPRELLLIWVHTWAMSSTGEKVAPSPALKESLHRYLTSRKVIADEIIIVDGATEPVPLHIQYKFSPNFDSLTVQESVRSAVSRVFKNLTPGSDLILNDLYQEIRKDGVQYCNVLSPSESVKPSSGFSLLSNSIQPGEVTRIAERASIGQSFLVVQNPSSFRVGGRLSVFDVNRSPTCSKITSISGSTIFLETPLLDSYESESFCIGSDWFVYGWCYERPISVHVRYDASAGGAEVITKLIKDKIKNYFTKQILPGQSLTRFNLQNLVNSVSGVESSVVNLGSSDSSSDLVSTIPHERVVLDSLYINGISV